MKHHSTYIVKHATYIMHQTSSTIHRTSIFTCQTSSCITQHASHITNHTSHPAHIIQRTGSLGPKIHPSQLLYSGTERQSDSLLRRRLFLMIVPEKWPLDTSQDDWWSGRQDRKAQGIFLARWKPFGVSTGRLEPFFRLGAQELIEMSRF